MAEKTRTMDDRAAELRRRAQQRYRERMQLLGLPEVQRIDTALSYGLSQFALSASRASNAASDKMLSMILRKAMDDLEQAGFDRDGCKPRLLKRLAMR